MVEGEGTMEGLGSGKLADVGDGEAFGRRCKPQVEGTRNGEATLGETGHRKVGSAVIKGEWCLAGEGGHLCACQGGRGLDKGDKGATANGEPIVASRTGG